MGRRVGWRVRGSPWSNILGQLFIARRSYNTSQLLPKGKLSPAFTLYLGPLLFRSDASLVLTAQEGKTRVTTRKAQLTQWNKGIYIWNPSDI